MSQYPQAADVFVNKTGSDNVSSSDPNNSFDGIEAVQGLIGILGEPQTWSTTLITLLRRYKRGMYVDITSGTLTVRSGEAVLENTDGTKFGFRRNTGDVALGAGNIDVGALVATTYYIYATAKGAATTTPLMFSTDALAPSGIGTAPFRKLGWFENAAAAALAVTYAGGYNIEPTEKILNIVYFQTGAVATGTGIIPVDNTIPQKTEGDQYLFLPYAASNANNRLKIDVVLNASASGYDITAGLFVDSIANALISQVQTSPTDGEAVFGFTYFMAAGTTAVQTFKVRAGPHSATTLTVNGRAGGALYNGTLISSITITEIAS